ncbi:TonB-dependent receptor domain-containing protein [Simiduia aestuariiviva]|uniref:Vitamin B12 transporter n=1 Tax=Simiduia aestuariiviva TaxID=1510459 RepID=A0A839UGL0_9GAMM|nr:TonB-dependent receptor [Simiduia aestuariiviva]MBB3167184.1 vitamin B12 transporter [Simiduia aestuariiviva]
MTLIKSGFIASLAFAVHAHALAADAAGVDATTEIETEEVLVTATRTAQPLTETLAPVSVLSADDIAALQAPDLPALLRGFTGVDIIQRGGRGANSSAFVRGTNAGHLLVLVDGVRVGSATLGIAALETLDPAAIERIELVRGPRSSLYGADAIGGILQIFTRKASEPGLTMGVAGSYGSHNEQHLRTTLGYKTERSHLRMVFSHNSTDGFDRSVDDSGLSGDDDGYSANRVALSAGHQLADALSLSANLQYQEGEADTDSAFCVIDCRPFARFANGSADLGLQAQLTDIWSSQLRLGFAQDKSEQDDHIRAAAIANWGGRNRIETERETASWQNDFALTEDQMLTLGVDYLNDKVDGQLENRIYAPDWSYSVEFVGYDVDDRASTGVFGQYQARVGEHDLVASARTEDNAQFGTANTGSLAYGYQLSDSWTLLASTGTAFKAPTFNDLYWPNAGNPDLQPETSTNVEVGARFARGNVQLAVNVFENKVDDLIAWAPTMSGNWQPSNVAKATILGAEVEFDAALGEWQLAANYTWLDAEDDASGKALPNRAAQLFNADISRRLGDLTLALAVEARSKRYADAANTLSLAGYGLLNARLAWNLSRELVLEAKVNNVLDKDYTLVQGFYQDGVNGSVGARYSF